MSRWKRKVRRWREARGAGYHGVVAEGGGQPRFGHLVKEWRDRRAISQQALAERVGVSPSYVTLIENGQRGKNPSRELSIAFAQALAAPVVDFLQAAGRLTDDDLVALQDRPSFEEVVRADPRLRADQCRILIDLYRSWVSPASDD